VSAISTPDIERGGRAAVSDPTYQPPEALIDPDGKVSVR
jgi:hypothetical protein